MNDCEDARTPTWKILLMVGVILALLIATLLLPDEAAPVDEHQSICGSLGAIGAQSGLYRIALRTGEDRYYRGFMEAEVGSYEEARYWGIHYGYERSVEIYEEGLESVDLFVGVNPVIEAAMKAHGCDP